MGFRDTAEIEASFRPAERALDAMLEGARACLERERVAVRDESNRSGFDRGFPSFIWQFRFERRVAYGSEFKRAAASLLYREPAVEDEARVMEVTTLAEIFQVGKQSRVREVRERFYPLGRFLDMRMEEVVLDCIDAAEQLLARD